VRKEEQAHLDRRLLDRSTRYDQGNAIPTQGTPAALS